MPLLIEPPCPLLAGSGHCSAQDHSPAGSSGAHLGACRPCVGGILLQLGTFPQILFVQLFCNGCSGASGLVFLCFVTFLSHSLLLLDLEIVQVLCE
jgi:hypothetical protein